MRPIAAQHRQRSDTDRGVSSTVARDRWAQRLFVSGEGKLGNSNATVDRRMSGRCSPAEYSLNQIGLRSAFVAGQPGALAKPLIDSA